MGNEIRSMGNDASVSGTRAGQVAPDHRAEIVDRIYEVALDPVRLETLMAVWERHIGPLRSRSAPGEELDDPELEIHASRAAVFLGRIEATRGDAAFRSVLDEIPRAAAFISDGGPAITASNRAATLAFGLREGAALEDLPFEPADIAHLRGAIRRICTRKDEGPVLLRLRSSRTGGPVILRVGLIEAVRERPLALVITTELVWPARFEETVQDAFGLTLAEVEVVRGIALGQPVKEIAEARGRSAETVRTQLRSILAKTETHSQPELVRVVLGLMDLAAHPSDTLLTQAPRQGLAALPFRRLTLADGRQLEWIEFGAPTGAPLLYMHGDLGLIRWPAPAERAARTLGIRVIVPVRAGYGRSDLHGRGSDHLAAATLDYASVLDSLRVRRVSVIALGADLRFAMNLSILRPDLVSGILGCAAQLPLPRASLYDRMDSWQRFMLANARFAPKVLPFLVQSAFSLARRLGKEAFFSQVNGGSDADMETFSRPDVRDAILEGSEVCLGRRISAHEAFSRECIGSERDWSGVVRSCRVPVLMLQGDQDPGTPQETIRELIGDYPHLRIRFIPNTGQLLFFAQWRLVLDEVQRFLVRGT